MSFPLSVPLSGGIVGTHELPLTVGAPCYKSSRVPSALWAAEHRTGAAGVCVVVSDTQPSSSETERPRLQFVARESRNMSRTCGREPSAAWGAGGAACRAAQRPPTGLGISLEERRGGGRVGAKKIAGRE